MNKSKLTLLLAASLLVAWASFATRATDQPAAASGTSAAMQAYERWLETHGNFTRPADVELKQKLSKLQYQVTQEDGTERPFRNAYWDNKRQGIYVDIVSGEPLFSSTDKYRSGTGWPSFIRPIHDRAMVTREDRSWFGVRTELRSAVADSHLGHVFDDGPAPTGLRYCINSASLRFIAKEDLAREGYAEFLPLFE